MFLLSLPVFVFYYLAGRLTEDLGVLFGVLGLLLAIILLFLMIPPGDIPAEGFWFWWAMIFFLGFIPRFTIVVIAAFGGYFLGQHHRPKSD